MYKSIVQHDSDMNEYFIILPQELMEEIGIEVGDELIWTVNEDKIYLSKK